MNGKAIVSLHPNPGNNSLVIALTEPTVGKIYVHDDTGRMVKSTEMVGENKCIFHTSNLNSGIYFVAFVNQGGKTATRK